LGQLQSAINTRHSATGFPIGAATLARKSANAWPWLPRCQVYEQSVLTGVGRLFISASADPAQGSSRRNYRASA
jgi:hypothetical protein